MKSSSDESTSASTTSSSTTSFREDQKVLYINLIVLDPSVAVEQKVSVQLEQRKKIPNGIKKGLAKVATRMATPERVSQKMAAILPEKLPEKLQQKGLTSVAETVFCQGPYLVLQLQILKVSPEAMVEAQSMDQYHDDGTLKKKATLTADWAERLLSWIRAFLAMIGVQNQQALQEDWLPRLLQTRLEDNLGDLLAGKLEEKGIEAVTQVCPEADQARYFYDTLKDLRAQQQQQQQSGGGARQSITGQIRMASDSNGGSTGRGRQPLGLRRRLFRNKVISLNKGSREEEEEELTNTSDDPTDDKMKHLLDSITTTTASSKSKKRA